jgi:glycerol-3-phosphate dehydrogenase
MRRDLERLTSATFDVVIVGGGMYGACLAWEATLRGLRVALVEKSDFGWSTSANMHRILHGGFRYLRNADVKRIRESVRERNMIMRLAPHLTGPLPVLIPTYPWGVQNREVMRIAIRLYDLLARDRNRGIEDPAHQIPAGRVITKQECLDLVPGLRPDGVTGGAIWYDGRIEDPARLALEVVRTASDAGAVVVNYVSALDYLATGERVEGVRARDELSGRELDVRGRMVVRACGPWSHHTLPWRGQKLPGLPQRFVRTVDAVTRPLTRGGHGLAFMGPKPGRPEEEMRYFMAPWRGYSVIGSVDYMHDTDPDAFAVQSSELEELLSAANRAIPAAKLTMSDIIAVQVGLIPHDDTEPLDDPYNAARHYRIVDHAGSGGPDGLMSIVGIKYTTARDIAQKATDIVLKRLGKPSVPSTSSERALHYGRIPNLAALLASAETCSDAAIDAQRLRSLATIYGPKYVDLVELVRADAAQAMPIVPGSPVLRAQVKHAVEREMACKLLDVVVRRTSLADDGHPGATAVQACAELMTSLLGWDTARQVREIRETDAYLKRFWARPHARTSGVGSRTP